ncbi:MAG: hypothetical protein OXI82_04345, partial [Nitrospinae bacterium]|nr:hypothetical protein [Nitrospinota bacterium]
MRGGAERGCAGNNPPAGEAGRGRCGVAAKAPLKRGAGLPGSLDEFAQGRHRLVVPGHRLLMPADAV